MIEANTCAQTAAEIIERLLVERDRLRKERADAMRANGELAAMLGHALARQFAREIW